MYLPVRTGIIIIPTVSWHNTLVLVSNVYTVYIQYSTVYILPDENELSSVKGHRNPRENTALDSFLAGVSSQTHCCRKARRGAVRVTPVNQFHLSHRMAYEAPFVS